MAEKRALTIGGRIRQLRESRALTQEVLAVRSGLGVATLRRVEKGENAPRRGTVEKIAAALEVKVDELLGKAS